MKNKPQHTPIELALKQLVGKITPLVDEPKEKTFDVLINGTKLYCIGYNEAINTTFFILPKHLYNKRNFHRFYSITTKIIDRAIEIRPSCNIFKNKGKIIQVDAVLLTEHLFSHCVFITVDTMHEEDYSSFNVNGRLELWLLDKQSTAFTPIVSVTYCSQTANQEYEMHRRDMCGFDNEGNELKNGWQEDYYHYETYTPQ